MGLFEAMVNIVATILVYGFVAILFWNAFQTVLNRLKPKEPPMQDPGGMEYE